MVKAIEFVRLAEQANQADGFALLAVGPAGALVFVKQNPLVYALHASPDAPAVDLYAGDALLSGGLSFGNIAGPVRVPPVVVRNRNCLPEFSPNCAQ